MEIVGAYLDHAARGGGSPLIREVAERVGGSPQNVHLMLSRLVGAGVMSREPVHRGYRVTSMGIEVYRRFVSTSHPERPPSPAPPPPST